jgi:serine/threonine protein kinase
MSTRVILNASSSIIDCSTNTGINPFSVAADLKLPSCVDSYLPPDIPSSSTFLTTSFILTMTPSPSGRSSTATKYIDYSRCDAYALGRVMFDMICDTWSSNILVNISRLVDVPLTKCYSPALRHLIGSLLDPDPDDRLSLEDAHRMLIKLRSRPLAECRECGHVHWTVRVPRVLRPAACYCCFLVNLILYAHY